MNAKLIPASREYRQVIINLMQFYIYDFSEFVYCDVEKDGLFRPYPQLEEYWSEENNKFPYIILKDQNYVGFVLVRFIDSEKRKYFSIAEFFIMRKYRRGGIGTAIAKQVFDLHKGSWEVFQKESNKPAQAFWKKVIAGYTKGQFTEHFETERIVQAFEN